MKIDKESRCSFCGCIMEHIDDSYLSEGGWTEDEWFKCNNKKCITNKKNRKGKDLRFNQKFVLNVLNGSFIIRLAP